MGTPGEPESPPTAPLLRLLRTLGVDRAVFYSLLLRGWQLPAGLISAVLIMRYFTGDVQGYYYTFASLTAMQTFFELNMFLVVINISSHEWAELRLDAHGALEGAPAALSRLTSFGRQLLAWYGAASLLFAVIVGLAGVVFFRSSGPSEVAWQTPWLLTVAAHALLLWCLPLNAMLEGCNQVATVYRFRVIQAVVANLVVWICIVGGGLLWTAVGAAVARLACELYLLGVRYRRFFAPLRNRPLGPAVSWRQEVWPMQWRLGISGVFSYFAFFLFTPVLFKYQGAVVAGQMGMTWVVLTAIQAAALSWVQTKAPQFGMLVAARNYRELDTLFFRMLWRSLLALLLAGSLVLGLLLALQAGGWHLQERLLDPGTTAIFLLALLIYQIPSCLATYMRAHKREPLLIANIVFCTAVGLAVWWGGSRYGARGAAWGYLAVVALQMLPHYTLIWWLHRQQWHREN